MYCFSIENMVCTCLSILLTTFNCRVRGTSITCFSRTICSLSKYNVKCEWDCFNCKTGILLRLFTSMFIKETNYNPRFCEKKSNRLWPLFKGYFSLSDFSCLQLCDQRYRRRLTRERQPTLPVAIIPLNSALCTHPTNHNRQVRSSLKVTVSDFGD